MRYILEPEVSGELGEKTIIDNSVHPPVIYNLHFIFKGWLGDDIIECFPVYLVSENLGEALLNSNLSGFELEMCLIDSSEEMEFLQPNVKLQVFLWLKVTYDIGYDFFIDRDNKLSVSEKAYSVLNKFNLNYCDITKG
jgi:hypothetical protein